MRTILIALAVSAAFAQDVEFEVASVKPAVSAPFGGRFSISGPMNSPRSLTSRTTLAPPILSSGWVDTERYDIDAKYPAETKPEDFRLMLQKLLTGRFHLTLHRETRQMPGYRLLAAMGGPKLSPAAKPPEYKDDAERKAAMDQQMARTQAPARKHSGPSSNLTDPSAAMAKLAEHLSANLEQPVTDNTGLKGSYSLSLEWLPDESAPAADNPLEEQLGLKLEPEKPVEFRVIDRADKTPVEN
jgi:uncharacterized protein (TIGR03435 family)